MKILDVLTSPWAIAPEKLAEIKSVYRAHFAGEKIDWKNIEAKIGLGSVKRAKDAPSYEITNGVAVIEVTGVLTKGLSFFSFLFGGTSTRDISNALTAALKDDAVKSIILHVDSPGGTVSGTQELAAEVFAARGQKPIAAYSDGQVTSAAYWIASAADKVYLAGDTVVAGSIGVVATHVDYSKNDEMHGIKVTEVTAGKYKRIYSENAPLSPEGRQTLQDEVDYLYSVFVNDVARQRGVFVEDALAMADGKLFFGRQAIDAGLVDGIITMEGLINKMAGGAPDIFRAVQNNQTKEDTDVDLKTFKEKYPDLYKSVADEGRAEAQAEAEKAIAEVKTAHEQALKDAQAQVDAGVETRVQEERARIKKIRALAVFGHDAIIEEAIESGASVEETTLKIAAAEKTVQAGKLDALKKDGEKVKVEVTDGAGADEARAAKEAEKAAAKGGQKTDLAGMTPEDIEAACQKEWDASEEVRREFKFGGFKSYLAFRKNEKNIRIKGEE